MCGRFAFWSRPSEVRRQLEEANMPCDDAPDDDSVRQTYNFAPGYNGLVYRADVSDLGAGKEIMGKTSDNNEEHAGKESTCEGANFDDFQTHYKLQAMKWGLIPFWTKRNPDYSSLMRTINCRDDSLIENRGMWTTMKLRKRCIVLCQGYYEWLKKNNGKEKIPHFVKRKDGQPMCLAGLWDCVQYEDAEEKLYSFTIITTDPNKQLSFLHDRMPVVLENGADEIWQWLDPKRHEWTSELQSLLRPYGGEMECYPVSKDVGKVGNNSPSFVVPIDSAENKNNIANFFGNQKRSAKGTGEKREVSDVERDIRGQGTKVKKEEDEDRETAEHDRKRGADDDNNAPLPASSQPDSKMGIKREHEGSSDENLTAPEEDLVKSPPPKLQKTGGATSGQSFKSPQKPGSGKVRSATRNESGKKSSPSKTGGGSQKITAFFGK